MPVPQTPTVEIYFTGLLVFCFNKRLKRCEIGIVSKDDHELRLQLLKKGPSLEGASESKTTISRSQIREYSDLWLDVEGELSPEQRGAEPFISSRLDEPPTDEQDFRWVVDLEGEHFYNRQLKVRKDVLKPILYVTQGLFYTAMLSLERYRTVPVGATEATMTSRSLGQIAGCVGANIYLNSNQALVLRAGRNGSELWRLKKEDGATYEITVENGDTPQAPIGSDFYYYYDAFELNPGEPRILIEPYGLPVFGGGITNCESTWLGTSDGLGFD